MKLLQNPFVKIIGIVIILYYALFADKNDPESLGNRFSGVQMERNVREIKHNSYNVLNGIAEGKKQEQQLKSQSNSTENATQETTQTHQE